MTDRKIFFRGEELTADEYVRYLICVTQKHATKKELIELCETREILSLKSNDTKDILYNKLIKDGVSPKGLANRVGVGVSGLMYQLTFGIDHKRVKKLEEQGVITVVGRCSYDGVHDDPLYDVYEYCGIDAAVVTGEVQKTNKEW